MHYTPQPIDFVAPLGVIIVFGVALAAWTRDMSNKETQVAFAGFGYHILCALAIVLITSLFYGGDMIGYTDFGTRHAKLMYRDPLYYGKEILGLLLKQPANEIPFTFSGSATGSMQALATFCMFIFGTSLYAAAMMFGMLSFFAQLTMYKVFRGMFPQRYHLRMQLGFLFLPSVGFWASGMLKESVAFAGFAPFFWGCEKILRGQKRVRALMAIALGMAIISLVKAYILFPLVFATGVAFYWYRTLKRYGKVAILKKPWQLVFYAMLTIGGVLGLGKVFPKYSIDNIGAEAANLQYYGARREGTRSNYTVGNYQEKSLTGQMMFMPVGLAYSLFRPFPFEIRNAAMALNVLEMLLLYYLWIRVLMARPLKDSVKMVLSHPLLMFCLVFVLLFGASVGIATTNVGTLSRYRMPMMPFYAVLLLILECPQSQDKGKRRAPSQKHARGRQARRQTRPRPIARSRPQRRGRP